MTWNYRIIHYKSGGYGLHEVFYDEDNKPDGYTENPIDFQCEEDEPDGVTESLWRALKDSVRYDVLEEAEFDTGKRPR